VFLCDAWMMTDPARPLLNCRYNNFGTPYYLLLKYGWIQEQPV
jgi:hypothetical protein